MSIQYIAKVLILHTNKLQSKNCNYISKLIKSHLIVKTNLKQRFANQIFV